MVRFMVHSSPFHNEIGPRVSFGRTQPLRFLYTIGFRKKQEEFWEETARFPIPFRVSVSAHLLHLVARRAQQADETAVPDQVACADGKEDPVPRLHPFHGAVTHA